MVRRIGFSVRGEGKSVVSGISCVSRSGVSATLGVVRRACGSGPGFVGPCCGLVSRPASSSGVNLTAVYDLDVSKVLVSGKVVDGPECNKLLRLARPPLFVSLVSCGKSARSPRGVFLTGGVATVAGGGKPGGVLTDFGRVPCVSHRRDIGLLRVLGGDKFSVCGVKGPEGMACGTGTRGCGFKVIANDNLGAVNTVVRGKVSIRIGTVRGLLPFRGVGELWLSCDCVRFFAVFEVIDGLGCVLFGLVGVSFGYDAWAAFVGDSRRLGA